MLFMLSPQPAPSRIRLRVCRSCEASNEAEAKHCTQCSAGGLSQAISAYPDGSIILGKYRVEKLLGCGGMGVVYQAKHLALQRKVAIKCIHPHMVTDSEVLARFQREAMATSSIDHPNVLRVNDLDLSEDGSPLLVTELLIGRDLDRVLRQGESLPVGRIISLLTQTLEGLYVAHQKGILHRDLKPANLFITEQDGKEQIKIVDFGLAKLLGQSHEQLTSAGVSMGTPAYMSPEQVRGEPLDPRADLWSVGVILYQMLTGRLPFTGDSPVSTAMSVLKGDFLDSPRDTPEGPRRDLWALCKSAISLEKERRPASAKEFRDQLQEIWAAHTLPSEELPAKKSLTRESPRALYTVSALAFAGLFAFLAVSFWPQPTPAGAVAAPHTAAVKPPQSTSAPALPKPVELQTQSEPASAPETKPAALLINKPKNPPKEPKETPAGGLQVPPGQSKFSYAKGLLLSGKTKDATTLLTEVVQAEPNNSSAHRWLGDAYLKLGKKSQAIAQWKEFLRLDPSHSDAKRVKEQIQTNQ